MIDSTYMSRTALALTCMSRATLDLFGLTDVMILFLWNNAKSMVQVFTATVWKVVLFCFLSESDQTDQHAPTITVWKLFDQVNGFPVIVKRD